MARKSEFRLCFEELEHQRALLLESEAREDQRETELLKSVTELAHDQLSALQTINDFFSKFASISLEERLEGPTIHMPGRSSACDLIETTKAALDIYKIRMKSDEMDPHRVESQKSQLSRVSHSDFGNFEFNKNFRDSVGFFRGNVGLTRSDSGQNEEFGDSTVNTIVSEDVLASSPI